MVKNFWRYVYSFRQSPRTWRTDGQYQSNHQLSLSRLVNERKYGPSISIGLLNSAFRFQWKPLHPMHSRGLVITEINWKKFALARLAGQNVTLVSKCWSCSSKYSLHWADQIIKPPLATARAASCNSLVHLFVCLFVCLSVCLSVAKIQKRDFLKN